MLTYLISNKPGSKLGQAASQALLRAAEPVHTGGKKWGRQPPPPWSLRHFLFSSQKRKMDLNSASHTCGPRPNPMLHTQTIVLSWQPRQGICTSKPWMTPFQATWSPKVRGQIQCELQSKGYSESQQLPIAFQQKEQWHQTFEHVLIHSSCLLTPITDLQAQNPFNILTPGLSFSKSNHTSCGCLKIVSALQPDSVSGWLKLGDSFRDLEGGLGSLGVRGLLLSDFKCSAKYFWPSGCMPEAQTYK